MKSIWHLRGPLILLPSSLTAGSIKGPPQPDTLFPVSVSPRTSCSPQPVPLSPYFRTCHYSDFKKKKNAAFTWRTQCKLLWKHSRPCLTCLSNPFSNLSSSSRTYMGTGMQQPCHLECPCFSPLPLQFLQISLKFSLYTHCLLEHSQVILAHSRSTLFGNMACIGHAINLAGSLL